MLSNKSTGLLVWKTSTVFITVVLAEWWVQSQDAVNCEVIERAVGGHLLCWLLCWDFKERRELG